VNQKRVGREGAVRSERTMIPLELNEHGPALNVFWSRSGGMGALSRMSLARRWR